MKQLYLIHEHHPRLLLFFAGWAADETPFRHYRPQGMDYQICYDYRTLDFDAAPLRAYAEVHVVGWSMGVWAASHVLPSAGLNVASCTALNGTPHPIDERRGIPPAIYQGTLDGLTGASLHKFLRRMCADSAAFRRSVDRLEKALQILKGLFDGDDVRDFLLGDGRRLGDFLCGQVTGTADKQP